MRVDEFLAQQMTPNAFAYVALFSWPLVVLILFRRLPAPAALIWAILGGYLFLPERLAVDLPVLPAIDKDAVPALSAAFFLYVFGRARPRRRGAADLGQILRDEAGAPLRESRRPHPLFLVLLALLLIAPFLTVLANGDRIRVGPTVLPALTMKDGYSMAFSALISLVPFLLARRHLARAEDQTLLLRALVGAGLAYSVLMLYEVRMSPQLHLTLYGIRQHSFAQHMRSGGFRPMVFLEHGLRVGLFIVAATLASAVMWRIALRLRDAAPSPTAPASGPAAAATNTNTNTNTPRRPARTPFRQEKAIKWALRLVWLAVILVLSRNLGATMILLLVLPVVLFLGIRTQVILAAALASIVLIYPLARGGDLIPIDRMMSMAGSISPDRAQSLGFRLRNEDMLLDRANQRPLFGWGGWDRNRVFDPVTGEDLSVTDGTWIIRIGSSGWVGYIGTFGLLCLPIVMLARRRGAGLDQAAAGLCLIMAANLLDLIPNSSLTPITWMIAGALAGRVELTDKVADAKGRRRMPAAGLRRPSPVAPSGGGGRAASPVARGSARRA